jgi:hypothetical protein
MLLNRLPEITRPNQDVASRYCKTRVGDGLLFLTAVTKTPPVRTVTPPETVFSPAVTLNPRRSDTPYRTISTQYG